MLGKHMLGKHMLGKQTKRRWHILMLMMLTLAMVLPGLASLPVVDRDEARFAQASVQMAETGDLLNIRLQDEARNKKPAAAYWAQTAMIKTFARDGDRRIWAHRIPSVLAALLSILALYWGGQRMVGRQAAVLGCVLLATSLIFVFESHIAKTDALLCAATTLIFASLARLRARPGRVEVWVFWIALGLSIMIKGPIGPVLAILSLLSLRVWEGHLSWARPLLNWGAILVFILIWLPWGIAIYAATDGAFFIDSLGQDFGGKVVSGQEGHGLPPGLHSLALWGALWPASLFFLPSAAHAVVSLRSREDNPAQRALRFIICWAVPFWILIEIMPTKLPHYGLPVFPALCLMMGLGIMAMLQKNSFAKSRAISALIFIVSTSFIFGVVLFAQTQHGDKSEIPGSFLICGLTGAAVLIASAALWKNKIRLSLAAALLSAIIMTLGTYSYILSNLTSFRTSENIAAELHRFAPNLDSGAIHSPHFKEPSLIYHVGKDISLKAGKIDLANGRLVILNTALEKTESLQQTLRRSATTRGRCIFSSKTVNGFNYSKGDLVSLVIWKEAPCAAGDPKPPT